MLHKHSISHLLRVESVDSCVTNALRTQHLYCYRLSTHLFIRLAATSLQLLCSDDLFQIAVDEKVFINALLTFHVAKGFTKQRKHFATNYFTTAY